jgi:hypothetical protein
MMISVHRVGDNVCPSSSGVSTSMWATTHFEPLVFDHNAVAGALVEGICCEHCVFFEHPLCPVSSADPWSRHKDYCGNFKSNCTGMGVLDTIITNLVKGTRL